MTPSSAPSCTTQVVWTLRQIVRGSLVAVAISVATLVLFPSTSVRADEPTPVAAKDRTSDKPYTETIPGTDVTFDMLPIPAGRFKMGSPATELKRKDDEGPQIDIKVDGFWMGKYVVTWTAYYQYTRNYQRLANKAPAVPKEREADAVTYPTPRYEMEAQAMSRMGLGDRSPAVIMSQFVARQYTKWLSKKTGRFYRLPTEAEWEYACRAGTTTAYNFGDDPKNVGDYAWYFDNSALADGNGAYHDVGRKKPNAWGLYDMHGNVAQWCIDQYQADWYEQFAGKTVTSAEVINWPKTLYPRVVRGGSYESEAEDCRSAARTASSSKLFLGSAPQSPCWILDGFWVGFRVVSPVNPPPAAERNKWWNADDPVTARLSHRDIDISELVGEDAGPAAQKVKTTDERR